MMKNLDGTYPIIYCLFVIITLSILNIACSRTEGFFTNYDEFTESSYFQGGWMPETVLPKSSYDIHIKNDLDVNRVWVRLSYKKNDSLVNLLKNSKIYKSERIEKLYKKYTAEYGKNIKYWSQPIILFGKISDNQYFAINPNENKMYYLRTRH